MKNIIFTFLFISVFATISKSTEIITSTQAQVIQKLLESKPRWLPTDSLLLMLSGEILWMDRDTTEYFSENVFPMPTYKTATGIARVKIESIDGKITCTTAIIAQKEYPRQIYYLWIWLTLLGGTISGILIRYFIWDANPPSRALKNILNLIGLNIIFPIMTCMVIWVSKIMNDINTFLPPQLILLSYIYIFILSVLIQTIHVFFIPYLKNPPGEIKLFPVQSR